MTNFRINTPHAAVIIWNYKDRIGMPVGGNFDSGVKDIDGIEAENEAHPYIISTLSCVSIQTSKSKNSPDGQFNLVLAPYKNWVSTISAGSWCAILMSNEPITESDLKKANPKMIKMLGRIESVRCDTKVDANGARQTLYYVSGVDWANIFNSLLYVDNLIAGPSEPLTQGNTVAIALRNMLFGKDNTPQSFAVKKNLENILSIMGKSLPFSKVENDIGRLANAVYEFELPSALLNYFNFKDISGKTINSNKSLNRMLTLKTGRLKAQNDYDGYVESLGFIDPFTLQGTHSLWQILLENSNNAVNEMFTEFNWIDDKGKDNGLQLCLYNRIRPFCYKGFGQKGLKLGDIQSYFQLVKYHDIDPVTVISVNVGTNWRDKFNFIEIKPQFQEFQVVANWFKQKSQVCDKNSFNREGFRALILDTKQFPSNGDGGLAKDAGIAWNKLEVWARTMREWYFNTHRMLNGTLTMTGSTEYIAVGNNVRFPIDLINPTTNIKKDTIKGSKQHYVLAHIESVNHSFSVQPSGARNYITTIQFVRGIIVDGSNVLVEEGVLDQMIDGENALQPSEDKNTKNVISQSDMSDPNSNRTRRK